MSEVVRDLGCREAPVEGVRIRPAFAQAKSNATCSGRFSVRVATRSPGESEVEECASELAGRRVEFAVGHRVAIELNGASPRRLSRPVSIHRPIT